MTDALSTNNLRMHAYPIPDGTDYHIVLVSPAFSSPLPRMQVLACECYNNHPILCISLALPLS